MPSPQEQSDEEKLASNLRERQQNILWPDVLRASRDTDEVLHKIRPKPLIQRMVGWILGACLMLAGAVVLIELKSGLLSIAFGTLLSWLGAHTFWVACKSGTKRHKSK